METTQPQRKRAAVKALFEQWGVPVELLARASSLAQSTIKNLIVNEQWVTHAGPAPLQAELMGVYREHLAAMQEDAEICPEKKARALGVLAKTLESITAMSVRLGAAQAKTSGDAPSNAQSNNDLGSDADQFGSEAQRMAHLDGEFAKLLEGLEKH
ncbi:MAG: hypothetical protein AAGK33_06330 [Pseudomonadota bacterium]